MEVAFWYVFQNFYSENVLLTIIPLGGLGRAGQNRLVAGGGETKWVPRIPGSQVKRPETVAFMHLTLLL